MSTVPLGAGQASNCKTGLVTWGMASLLCAVWSGRGITTVSFDLRLHCPPSLGACMHPPRWSAWLGALLGVVKCRVGQGPSHHWQGLGECGDSKPTFFFSFIPSIINIVENPSVHDTTALVTIEFLELQNVSFFLTLYAFLSNPCRESIIRE